MVRPGTDDGTGRRPAVGFIGLGGLGASLARSLLDREVPLIVFDRRAGAMAEFRARGATIAAGIEDLATQVDIAMVCVLDDAQVAEVVLGPGRLLEALGAGAIIVIHSTVSPALVEKLGEVAARKGVAVVDAPVIGGGPGSSKPVHYLVGGPDEAVQACLPCFDGAGSHLTLTGVGGSAMKAKLVHQLILCITHLAVDEGLRLARALALDLGCLATLVHEGPAQSNVADRLPGDSLLSGTAGLLRKDLALCLCLARDEELDLAGARAALELMQARDRHSAG